MSQPLSIHLLVFKTSWRRLQEMSWKRLQHVFSVTVFCLPRRPQDFFNEDVLKMFSRRLVRYLQDVSKLSARCICETSSRRLQDIFKTSCKTKNCSAEDVLKTSWRHLADKQNVYWNICVKPWPTNKSKSVSNKSIFLKSTFHESKANLKCNN